MSKRLNDNDLKALVGRLNAKRDTLLFQLINAELKRREVQRQLEKRMRKRVKDGYYEALAEAGLDDPLPAAL